MEMGAGIPVRALWSLFRHYFATISYAYQKYYVPSAIFGGVCCISMAMIIPETFAPVLLMRRAERLSQANGRVYVSKLEKDRQKKTLLATIKVALTRPWVLLCYEPIVLLLTIYIAILYGTVGHSLLCTHLHEIPLTYEIAIPLLRRLPHSLPRIPRLGRTNRRPLIPGSRCRNRYWHLGRPLCNHSLYQHQEN
jgi:hypothetical protein